MLNITRITLDGRYTLTGLSFFFLLLFSFDVFQFLGSKKIWRVLSETKPRTFFPHHFIFFSCGVLFEGDLDLFGKHLGIISLNLWPTQFFHHPLVLFFEFWSVFYSLNILSKAYFFILVPLAYNFSILLIPFLSFHFLKLVS